MGKTETKEIPGGVKFEGQHEKEGARGDARRCKETQRDARRRKETQRDAKRRKETQRDAKRRKETQRDARRQEEMRKEFRITYWLGRRPTICER